MAQNVKNTWRLFHEDRHVLKEAFDLMTVQRPGLVGAKRDRNRNAVTFGKILPRPEILDRVRVGGERINGKFVQFFMEDENPDPDGLPIPRLFTPEEQREIDATGFKSWDDWSRHHWGTKWDAYRTEKAVIHGDPRRAVLVFHTAWRPPEPVYVLLCDRFEGLDVDARFYDHDDGKTKSL